MVYVLLCILLINFNPIAYFIYLYEQQLYHGKLYLQSINDYTSSQCAKYALELSINIIRASGNI